jgi:hypothetical protein
MKKLVIFDLDDTLVHTENLVYVVKDNVVIHKLNSQEFTEYILNSGEHFDFQEFSDSKAFFEKSTPIVPMLNQFNRDIAESNHVVLVTARSDFDDKHLFLSTFRKFGIDIDRAHVYRAGNINDGTSIEDKKKLIIKNLLLQDSYSKAIMYDDSIKNLISFLDLSDDFPGTKFYAWAVKRCGNSHEFGRA